MTPRRRPRWLRLAIATLLLGTRAAAAEKDSPPEQLEGVVKMDPVVVIEKPRPKVLTEQVLASLYRPLTGDKIELAPDGKHIAFSIHEDDKIFLRIVEVDHPENVQSITVNVDAVPVRGEDTAKTPARVHDLNWAGPGRLVFAPTWFEIMAVDANGQNGLAVIDEKQFPKASVPHLIALPKGDPNHFLMEAFQLPLPGEDLWAVGYRVDHRTQKFEKIWSVDVTQNGSPFHDRNGFPRLLEIARSQIAVSTFKWRTGESSPWLDFESLFGKDLGATFRVDPETYHGHRSILLTPGYDPNVIYFASNVGRDTFGVYSFDVRTKQRTTLLEDPDFDVVDADTTYEDDTRLVFDRSRQQLVGIRLSAVERRTRWLDPEIAEVQRRLDVQFPGRSIQVLQWDDARNRFVVLASGSSEPGRFYIYHRQENSLLEITRRTGWIEPEDIHPTNSFTFTTPAGVKLIGYITRPRRPRLSPAPLVVYLHDGLTARVESEFSRRAQALAEMGFLVLRLNYRGSPGFGLAHRNEVREGFDRLPLEDVRATLASLKTRYPYNPKRVALMGRGFGGYLALRGLELFPDEFRCAIAINPLVDLSMWSDSAILAANGPGLGVTPATNGASGVVKFGNNAGGMLLMTSIVKTPDMPAGIWGVVGGGESLMAQKGDGPTLGNSRVRTFNPSRLEAEARRLFVKGPGAVPASSAIDDAKLITKPLLILTDEINAELSGHAARLHDALTSLNIEHSYEKITDEFVRDLPGAQYKTYDKIEEFLNLHIYDYKVNVGEATKVIDSPKPSQRETDREPQK